MNEPVLNCSLEILPVRLELQKALRLEHGPNASMRNHLQHGKQNLASIDKKRLH